MFYQLSVFWIFGPLPLYLLHKEWRTIDIYRGPNSIDGLIKDIMIQLPDVVLHSRLDKERDPPDLVDQIRPIGLHRPAPAVAVGTWIIHITDIVDQDPAEQGPNGFRDGGESKLSSPFPPELELHPDPVLGFGQTAFCCFVIDPDQNITAFTAMVNCNTRTTIIKFLFNLTLSKFTNKLLLYYFIITIFFISAFVGVPKQLVDVQDPSMVVKSHIQAGDMKALILRKQMKQPNKVTAAIFLKSPTSLT